MGVIRICLALLFGLGAETPNSWDSVIFATASKMRCRDCLILLAGLRSQRELLSVSPS